MLIASELKAGQALRIEGQIYRVLEVEVKAGTAKLTGVVKAKLRQVASGRMWEPHCRPDERLEDLEIEQRRMEFLYQSGDTWTFMNPENFEQMEVPGDSLGPAAAFLQPGMEVPMEFCEGQPINVVLPEVMEMRIANTAPPSHSQQDSAWKEARLENGMAVRVPLFIAPGEAVRVDVKTGRYIERVRSERRRSA